MGEINRFQVMDDAPFNYFLLRIVDILNNSHTLGYSDYIFLIDVLLGIVMAAGDTALLRVSCSSYMQDLIFCGCFIDSCVWRLQH